MYGMKFVLQYSIYYIIQKYFIKSIRNKLHVVYLALQTHARTCDHQMSFLDPDRWRHLYCELNITYTFPPSFIKTLSDLILEMFEMLALSSISVIGVY